MRRCRSFCRIFSRIPKRIDDRIGIQNIFADGYAVDYQYTVTSGSRLLSTITAPGGRSLAISLGSDGPSRIDLPDGTFLRYVYVTVWGRPRLERVERRDASNAVLQSESYLYENERLAFHITGILDSGGARLTRYAYDGAGRTIETGKEDGTEKLTLSYTYNDSTERMVTRVTNARGKHSDHVFSYNVLNGRQDVRLLGIDRPATANTAADSRNWTANSAENVTAYVDGQGTRTEFVYDTTSRPTTIRRAAGTAIQQTETYTWFSTVNLPLRVVRPGLTIDYVRDTAGRITQETHTDTTTHSLPYATAGQTRVWNYGYDGDGRPLSVNGPKPVDGAGRDDVTTYTYDAAGNLTQIANALGQITAFSNHDANGRPGRMTDANGIVTDLAYDLPGRLVTRTVRHPTDSAQDAVTTFGYDADGRITSLTQPATEALLFDYNPVGRLIAIRNAAGASPERTGLRTSSLIGGNLQGKARKMRWSVLWRRNKVT